MIFFIIGVVAALFALAVLLLAKEYKNSAIIPAVVAVIMIGISWRRLLFMSKGQACPGSIPGFPVEKNKTKGEKMERYSIALHGIDSYTKQPMYLPYKLDAVSVKDALHEARMCAMTFYPRFQETKKPDVEVIRK